jgi:hypothetical protein
MILMHAWASGLHLYELRVNFIAIKNNNHKPDAKNAGATRSKLCIVDDSINSTISKANDIAIFRATFEAILLRRTILSRGGLM